MENFYYKDTFVAVRNCKFRGRNHEDGKVCWCCEEEFQDNDECVLLINNYKHIPNMILHKKCFDNSNKESLCQHIEWDYQEYKKYQKIFN